MVVIFKDLYHNTKHDDYHDRNMSPVAGWRACKNIVRWQWQWRHMGVPSTRIYLFIQQSAQARNEQII